MLKSENPVTASTITARSKNGDSPVNITGSNDWDSITNRKATAKSGVTPESWPSLDVSISSYLMAQSLSSPASCMTVFKRAISPSDIGGIGARGCVPRKPSRFIAAFMPAAL